MQGWTTETLAPFTLTFSRPDAWQSKVEPKEEGPTTYLYWDEDCGSFRVTPQRAARPDFRVEDFLADVFAQEASRGRNPAYKTWNGLRFVCYVGDNALAKTRSHYFITGVGRVFVVCSFAYAKDLLDDDGHKAEVLAALGEVEKIFATMKLAG